MDVVRIGAGLVLAAGVARAQDTGGVEPRPAEGPAEVEREGVEGDPALSDPSLMELRDLLTRPGGSQDGVEPRRRAQIEAVMPGAGVTPGLWEAPLEAEGTFIVRRRATVLRAPTGEVVALLHADGDRPAQPVVLAPNDVLERLERTMEGRGLGSAYWITGQALIYRGRNYVLPTAFGISEVQPKVEVEADAAVPEDGAAAALDEGVDAGQDAGVDAGEEAAAGVLEADDPSVEALIRDLEERRRVPRGLTVEGRVEAEESSPAPGLREGTFLLRRHARIVRTGGGAWALALDGDAGSPAADEPMVVLPCLLLERLERIAGDGGEGASVEISGRVTAYKGRNFVLPSLFQVLPEREGIGSLQ